MSRGQAIVQVKDVRLSLGAVPLFDGVEMALLKGECACLVGANGAGKSTLLKIISQGIEPDAGVISRAGGVTLAFAAQEPDFNGAPTLRAYVEAGFGTPIAHHEAEAALIGYGLDPDRSPNGLSGGEARRAALARAFAADADVLLLDEPTNHLDIPAITDLEERLSAFRGASLIISHDRRFLERVSRATYWLRQRRVLKLDRGYAAFEEWAEGIETEQARTLSRLDTQLKAEERWLLRGVTARRSRNEGRRRKLMAMRDERKARTALAAKSDVQVKASNASTAGHLVIEAKGLRKAYGDRVIVDKLDLRVMRGDRIGLVGPNGAGKTTLIDLLLGRIALDAGTVRRAPTLTIAYVDQARALLDPTATVWDTLVPTGGDQIVVHGQPRHVASYARDFLFGPDQLRQPTAALSGGERNRLALAVTLAKPADLLVLDEPTNDLDMDTLDALEEMVASFDGTVMIVSHDRAFLDNVTTQIVGAIGQGAWRETPGGWADFEREHGGFRPQRGPPAQSSASTAAPTSETPRVSRKLSYKDARRLQDLEALLPTLDARIEALERSLDDTGFFARNPTGFNASIAELDALRVQKDAAETEWLTLEELRERLQG